MPRANLTLAEKQLLGRALILVARDLGFDPARAMAEAALTTMAELQTLVSARLDLMRADDVTALGQVSSNATTATTTLNSEIAAIDAAKAKLV